MSNKLKIFVADYGVYGCTLVAASSIERAKEILTESDEMYKYTAEVSELEVVEGILYVNYGDR